MLVVEGPDGAGKSTLVRALSEQFSLPVADRVVGKDTIATRELKGWVEANVAQGFHMTLYDRHRLISEPIYGSILRNTFEPGFGDVGWLQAMNTMFYKYCRPLIIYCLPPYEVVRANLENDPDNVAVVNKIRRIYAQYAAKAATDSVLANALVYDYTRTPANTIFRAVDLAVERMSHG